MTQSIQLRADGRAHSGYSHAAQYYPRRRWRTFLSYVAMTWRLIERPLKRVLGFFVPVAVLVTLGVMLAVPS